MLANSLPADRSARLNELVAALQEGRAPAFGMGDALAWGNALNDAMVHDRLDLAIHSARYLRDAFPTLIFAQMLCTTFERMPPVDESYVPFHDDLSKEVQIARRDNADTVMLVFCGRANRPGLPISLMHRWFGRLPASVIYLRDFRNLFYLAGIASLAGGREATLASLRQTISSLGARRAVCYGNSGGVFAALHYGLDLGAEAVLCLSGVTNVSAAFNARLRTVKSVARLNHEMPGAAVDLRGAYLKVAQQPRTRIVYAGNNWDDRIHAEHLLGLPNVTLQALPNTAEHNVVTELIRRGQYQDLLDQFVSR